MAVSYALFRYQPSLFYFRAWEYLMEILHPNPNMPQVWEGVELGDMSRNYLFRFQEPHYTRVSIDSDGFRRMPYDTDSYQIVLYGDSQGFGSGLSDEETFPWKLAVELGIPIFNGTRSDDTPEHLLGFKKIHEARILIHVVQSYAVSIKSYFPEDFMIQEYIPLRKSVWPVTVKRFNPFAVMMRMLKGLINDILGGAAGINAYMCQKNYSVPYSDGDQNKFTSVSEPGIVNDMSEQINMIDRYNRRLKELGYIYVLVLVPRRDLLYADYADEFTKNYFPRLIRSLTARGVHAVDLHDDFLANKHLGLFFRTDTHWNAKGTGLAASRVAKYLQEEGNFRSAGIIPEDQSVPVGTKGTTKR
jgi:hypothetical protein